MLRPMKLEGALKLYISLYTIAFLFTFLTSVPMLVHVAPKSECLLFTTPPPVKYGSAGGCVISGVIPLGVAVCALGLIFIHWLELKRLREHIKLPEITSDEFRQAFKKKFWKLIIFHSVVLGMVAADACILTSGYATSCHNLYKEIETKLRSRIPHTPIENRGGGGARAAHEVFADDFTINRYSNDNQDFLGRNKYVESITCRSMFTDERNHYELKKNTGQGGLYAAIYGFWNSEQNVGEKANFKYIAERDNQILEISLAGAWIGLFIWIIMLLFMLKERHHLKAFITDESMWGGSVRDYGEGSVRSGRSRMSTNGRLMSPVDFENMDRMSHHSKMSFDRSSRISKSSRASKGTSYKDMGRKHSSQNGGNSYKDMNQGVRGGPPSQLTVSRLEKVPEVDTDYTVKRLLNDPNHPNHPGPANGGGGFSPAEHNDSSMADRMSMMTVTGAIIGPNATQGSQPRRTPGRNGGGAPGLMDYFGGGGVVQPAGNGRPVVRNTEESDII